ncbi:hypothetical protein EOJ36_03895 [Sandaracinomonas limnophila]|uniref:Uncharacterized protein n=1 Tax=Sandaracinomonas limnophila TaxID=1862386 RepID=A0A437PTK4_9BACT|nr:SIR2 family protein [Sandaracinomonas limnophila]RVU25569.1 hypothetical protein EOJ36_03895 [Sandaracinomonas limnophila]
MNVKFNHYWNTEKLKFTLLIGSGFHKEFLSNLNPKDSDFYKLKDWQCLIDYIKNLNKVEFRTSNNFLIDFEQIITFSSNTQSKQGHELEKNLTEDLSKELVRLSKIVETNYNSDILKIFNPNLISDVINLNFDTILEEKYASTFNIKFSKKTTTDYNKKGSLFKKIYSKSNFRYRELNGIKFWHPHGDVYHNKSLILSTRKYGNQLSSIEILRQNFKKDEKKNGFDFKPEYSWFDAIINKPLIILGAGLSANEQDILFAISSKKRNFLNNGEKEHPIFQMLEPGEKSNIGDWANPIFDNADYKIQWGLLINLFSKYEI